MIKLIHLKFFSFHYFVPSEKIVKFEALNLTLDCQTIETKIQFVKGHTPEVYFAVRAQEISGLRVWVYRQLVFVAFGVGWWLVGHVRVKNLFYVHHQMGHVTLDSPPHGLATQVANILM